jgi:GT2 family glycosyltransferase
LRPEIGVVGARLVDESESIKHAGTILGLHGCAGSAFQGFPRTSDGYVFRAQVIQNYSAVRGDCLVMRRSVFDDAGGLDEEKRSLAFSDVDLCLRIGEKGYRVLWTPYAEVLQAGRSLWEADDESLRTHGSFAEACSLKAKWGEILSDDPYYNPNLSLARGDFSLAWPPRIANPWK